MTSKQKKNENPIRELACTLVSAKYHRTLLSSKMESVFRGENKSFPCVAVESTMSNALTKRASCAAYREGRLIDALVKEAGLSDFTRGSRLELTFTENSSVNQLIGEIKMEIMAIDAKAARKARKS